MYLKWLSKGRGSCIWALIGTTNHVLVWMQSTERYLKTNDATHLFIAFWCLKHSTAGSFYQWGRKIASVWNNLYKQWVFQAQNLLLSASTWYERCLAWRQSSASCTAMAHPHRAPYHQGLCYWESFSWAALTPITWCARDYSFSQKQLELEEALTLEISQILILCLDSGCARFAVMGETLQTGLVDFS